MYKYSQTLISLPQLTTNQITLLAFTLRLLEDQNNYSNLITVSRAIYVPSQGRENSKSFKVTYQLNLLEQMTSQKKNRLAKRNQIHCDVSKRKQQVLQIIQLYYINRQIMKYRYTSNPKPNLNSRKKILFVSLQKKRREWKVAAYFCPQHKFVNSLHILNE